MIRLRTTTAVMLLTLSTATTLHAQERVRSGRWENTLTAFGKTTTKSVCIKPAEAAKSNGSPAILRAEIEKASSESGCAIKNFKLEGNTLKYTMVCAEDSVVVIESTFHGGDSAETTMTFTAGGVTNVKQTKGRRTGACKAGEQQ